MPARLVRTPVECTLVPAAAEFASRLEAGQNGSWLETATTQNSVRR
jgi:hypothetical protein